MRVGEGNGARKGGNGARFFRGVRGDALNLQGGPRDGQRVAGGHGGWPPRPLPPLLQRGEVELGWARHSS